MKTTLYLPPQKMDSSCSNAGAVYFIIIFIRFELPFEEESIAFPRTVFYNIVYHYDYLGRLEPQPPVYNKNKETRYFP